MTGQELAAIHAAEEVLGRPSSLPRRYAVQGQRLVNRDGWSGSEGLPTFYLDASVQGIVSTEHAYKIAREIVGSGVSLTVVPVE